MQINVRIRRFLVLLGVLIVAGTILVVVVRALTTPPITKSGNDYDWRWLNFRKGESNLDIAEAYYRTIDAPDTLEEWRLTYGFDGVDEVRAVYYNAADLGFGRDMHCREDKDKTFVACVVGNYGLGPAGPQHIALDNAIDGRGLLASVAMVYEKSPVDGSNPVKFYVYDAEGNRINAVPLDSEGEKYVPDMCLACHGGERVAKEEIVMGEPVTVVTVTGANFLPFDPLSFTYSEKFGFEGAQQEDAFRQLNELVLETNPTAAIAELIEGIYSETTQTFTDFVAPGWKDTPEKPIYEEIITPYCRTCHIAQGENYQFNNAAQFGNNWKYYVFSALQMPHAELTLNNFWRYGDPGTPAFLAREAGWSINVNTKDDASGGKCGNGNSCSLREAIAHVKDNLGENNIIITFDPITDYTDYKPITLSLTGADADSTGDLDITGMTQTQRIYILGNGAGRTIIDAAGIDRIFEIDESAEVYLQGLTLRGGNTTGPGGAIYNQGNLIINDVIIENNTAVSGGAIANAGQLSLDDSAVISNTATTGAVIDNSGNFTLNTSTLSHNAGTGLVNSGAMTLNYSTITENDGGGLLNPVNAGGTVTMGTTALAANGGADCEGAVTSTGYNLVENGPDCLFTGETASNILGEPALLGPLHTPSEAFTPLHMPLPGSPLLDAVPYETDPFAFVSLADQHGTLRPQLDQNDIGAAERLAIEQTFMPVISLDHISAPDLVITSIAASADAFSVRIENQSDHPVQSGFWVDLYIDPDPVPTAVNQIWPALTDEGLVWGITDPLGAGEVLTLTYSTNPLELHPYFVASESSYSGELPPGTPVFVQVDSASTGSTYGAVQETHEISGAAYNNISSTTAAAEITVPQHSLSQLTKSWQWPTLPLPPR